MSVLYREVPQQSSSNVHASKGVSQFKAPLRIQSVQSDKLPSQGQRYSPPESTSSKGVSQFKTPLRLQSGLQSGKLLAQDRPYSASGGPPFNGASFFQVTNPSQPVVGQPEKRIEQSGSHVPSGMPLSNTAFQHARPTMSLPRVMALPSIVRDTSPAGEPITEKSRVLTPYLKHRSTDPYVCLPPPLSSLEALRQKRFSQFLRESDQSWQPALPRTEARMRSEALSGRKTHGRMKVILMAGTGLLVGGIASFLLLRYPTYLVVTWAILIIVFSNLVSRELRSYYRHTPPTLDMETVPPSTTSTPHDLDMERHPLLKDIGGTTDYLKALCLVFNNDYPTQTFPPEKEYQV